MRSARARVTLLIWVVAAAATAHAQTAEDVGPVRQDYEYGLFDEALQKAERMIDSGKLSPKDRGELHRYAGAAAFNLGDARAATRHFGGLLRIDPDARLD